MPEKTTKPQIKHLHCRVEYLLRALKKHIDQKKSGNSAKKSKKDLVAVKQKPTSVKKDVPKSKSKPSNEVKTPSAGARKRKPGDGNSKIDQESSGIKSKKVKKEAKQEKPVKSMAAETERMKIDSDLSDLENSVFEEVKNFGEIFCKIDYN